jgi:ATP-dependent Clp protease adapter protein ClpS
MDRTQTFIASVTGGILLAFGIVLAMFVARIVELQFVTRNALQTNAAVTALSCLVMSVFFLVVGYRLLFNRPNRNGSLLSPIGWMVLAVCFFAVGAVVAAIGMSRGDYQAFVAAVGLAAFGCLSVIAGRRRQSPLFPPETSLLRLARFAPPGFTCGLEILNDDRTPMAFVVSVLRHNVGLSEIAAIRTMLEIHKKGGMLLPMPSSEEANRVAEVVTAAALVNNHPLVCRAVRVE